MGDHFDPWRGEQRRCWHCVRFVAMVYQGSAAWCSLPNGPRVRSQPEWGCGMWVREVGADDEPRPPRGAID